MCFRPRRDGPAKHVGALARPEPVVSVHSLLVFLHNPLQFAWLAADAPTPLPGMGRKLPHYHKYSYLGFEGDDLEMRARLLLCHGTWERTMFPNESKKSLATCGV